MSTQKFAAKALKKPKRATGKPRKRTEQQLEAQRERLRVAYHAQTPAEKTIARWRKEAKPPSPGQGTWRATKARNVAVAAAYCDWSDIEEVVRMYMAAAIMTEITGDQYVLHHEVPLQHPLVCGLHVHTNLCVVSDRENRLKGNWIWPDMWEHTRDTLLLVEQLAQQREDRPEPAQDHEHSGPAAPVGHRR